MPADAARDLPFPIRQPDDRGCAACDHTGWLSFDVPPGHPHFGRLVPCECRAAERAEFLPRVCGLNAVERLHSLDDLIVISPATRLMVEAARAFVDRPVGFLTLHGSHGNGKTSTLQGIVNALIARNVMAVYVTAYDLVEWVKQAFQRDDDSAWSRILKFQSAPVVCIDEWDKARLTEYALELQTAIINRRDRDALAGISGTVLAMNDGRRRTDNGAWIEYGFDALPSAIRSRLLDGRYRVVQNNDPDRRPNMGG